MKVYVLLTDTGTILTKIIKLFTKEQHNHASISFDDNLNSVYSFGRKRSRNPFVGGFVRENVHEGLFRDANCAIYSYSISEIQFEKMTKKIREIEENKQNYKYNFLGLFAVAINKEVERKNAFFCSHFVAFILEESGVPVKKQKPLSLVTPHDIKETFSLNLVYEGKLAFYEGVKSTG
ncbi:hypothetical protein [Neobacillus sp. PS3-40]|uniref:hypothetical protein n=1 Tax=Neobacillus sp. PS3-40 TaxID=3070679 RepID=UPI0027DFED77|nr:hypothetical protein [Neobacillus sp. PS3-40]WML44307.1 hypothetical protein RCG20_21495 [Neobacillus sp. PS3-40]